MRNANKIIRIADKMVNWLIALCFIPLLLYGIYGLWDSNQINQQADASLYETYKPTAKDSISFAELQKKNPEVIGWLTVDHTHIDYPLVQGEDNSKYVNTDPLGAFSLSGSIFLDYNNRNDFSDMNSIILRSSYGERCDVRRIGILSGAVLFSKTFLWKNIL